MSPSHLILAVHCVSNPRQFDRLSVAYSANMFIQVAVLCISLPGVNLFVNLLHFTSVLLIKDY